MWRHSAQSSSRSSQRTRSAACPTSAPALPTRRSRRQKRVYVAKIVYQNSDAKVVGSLSDKYDTVAGFNAGAAALLANIPLATAHGGTAARDSDTETYSATIKCYDPNGELYNLTFTRSQVTLSSYMDDAIRAKVETWADTVPALA